MATIKAEVKVMWHDSNVGSLESRTVRIVGNRPLTVDIVLQMLGPKWHDAFAVVCAAYGEHSWLEGVSAYILRDKSSGVLGTMMVRRVEG